jgi:hypothetical protein
MTLARLTPGQVRMMRLIRQHQSQEIADVESDLPTPEDYPRYALMNSYLRRLKDYTAEIEAGEKLGIADFDEFQKRLKELQDLRSWIYEPISPFIDRERGKMIGNVFVEVGGYRYDQAYERIEKSRTVLAKSGAPLSDNRVRVVRAFKALLTMKIPNYPRLAEDFCVCGKVHDHRCADRLRKQIDKLKSVLGELETPLSA